MLLVKGVNVFPNAVRDVVAASSDLVGGEIQILRYSDSAVVEAPVDVEVCLKPHVASEARARLAQKLEAAIQNKLRFRARVHLIEPDNFSMEYGATGKAKLVRTIDRPAT